MAIMSHWSCVKISDSGGIKRWAFFSVKFSLLKMKNRLQVKAKILPRIFG